MGEDLRGLEPGTRGDLVLEWVRFDTDGDNLRETLWPRLRLVRQASAAEVQRARRAAPAPGAAPPAPGNLEVVWMVAPASLTQADARAEGVVWRGERVADDPAGKSFFAPDFFGASNRPPAGATDEVSGGLLWMQVLCAGQTSIVNDGWRIGSTLDAAATSWDARGAGRPDADEHPWNQAHPGFPAWRSRAILPRRVRIELEFERPADRARRTRLLGPIDNQEAVLVVDDPRRLPDEPGAHVRIGAEWMRVRSIDGARVGVQRAQRGSAAAPHEAGALVHWGLGLAREVVVATYREDWNL
jgi:hypothetical protein